MEASPSELVQSGLPDAEPAAHKPSRLECLGGVIVSPVKTFEHLASNPQWLFPLIILMLWVFMNFIVGMAVTMSIMFSRMPERTGSEAGERLFSYAIYSFIGVVSSSGLGLVVGTIGVTAILSAMAAALYLIARAFKLKPRFYPLITTLAYAEFVPRLVGTSFKESIPLVTGDFSFAGARLPTGILPIFSEFDLPLLLRFLLGRIELFHIWSFALVAISLRFTLGASKERAVLITVLYWAVCIGAITGAFVLWGLLNDILFFD